MSKPIPIILEDIFPSLLLLEWISGLESHELVEIEESVEKNTAVGHLVGTQEIIKSDGMLVSRGDHVNHLTHHIRKADRVLALRYGRGGRGGRESAWEAKGKREGGEGGKGGIPSWWCDEVVSDRNISTRLKWWHCCCPDHSKQTWERGRAGWRGHHHHHHQREGRGGGIPITEGGLRTLVLLSKHEVNEIWVGHACLLEATLFAIREGTRSNLEDSISSQSPWGERGEGGEGGSIRPVNDGLR